MCGESAGGKEIGVKRRLLITGGYLDASAWYTGSYRRMMTELLSSAEFADAGRWAGEIYVDLAEGEDDGPEQGPLIAKWQAILVILDSEKAIISLTIRGPDGEELA